MLVLGDAGEGGARLALAAGAQGTISARLQEAELVLVEIAEVLRQVAGVDRDLDDAVQRAARDDELAPGRLRGVGHALDAGDVGGKRRHRDPALGALDDLGQRARRPRPRTASVPRAWRWSNRTTRASTPSSPSACERAVIGRACRPSASRRASSRRCGTRCRAACGWTSALISGIECARLTNSMSNGPTLKREPSGTSVIGIFSASPYSASFDFSMPAVKGVA